VGKTKLLRGGFHEAEKVVLDIVHLGLNIYVFHDSENRGGGS
jgi:hypothetical protein